jgi:TP901 family phage tail tape measure protein
VSEFLGEARVVIRPDTTRFRTELVAALATATRGLTVPVPVTAAITGSAAASTAALAASTSAATGAIQQQTAALQAQGVATAQTQARTQSFITTERGLEKGAFAAAAGMTGLRGAVLSASGPFLAGAVAATAFGKAIQSAANLESDLNVFRVTAGATADEMERVAETAKALGRDLTLPGVTAGDAAQTFLALSRAGLSVENSLDGARGVLQLAVAAQISFADAAQITASALNAFSLAGDEAVNVADLLTNAANSSQASISDMGIALRQSAAIADLAGFSLSETATFLTQLARAGLAGSDAGTSFRVSIQRLIAPTGAARKELDRLNVNLRDAAGNLRPEAFFELGDALERMGRAQGDATRQIIFGNDASRAAAFFARLNAQSFRELETELTKAGSAAEVAGARNAGFAGSVENLKNQLTALGIEIGELALPGLGLAADVAALFFGSLATQIADTRDVLGSFNEDAEKLQTFFQESLDQGGFVEGFKAADDAVNDFLDDLDRISGADDFVNFLTGAGDAAATAAPKITRLTNEEKRLAEAIHDAVRPTVEQTTTFDELAAAAARAAAAVSRLQGQERGLEEQVTRARIAGDEGAEIAGLQAQRETLERELAAQEAIIARPGTGGDATAREAIRSRILPRLEDVNNEINNIIEGQKTENERLASDAARAASERDRALLEALAGRREDAERAITAAGDTESLQDDIRRQDTLQALIKQQIQKVRDRIKDEKTRTAAIRELRQALIDSRREEDALRREQREAARARAAEQQERIDQIQQLNIDIASERGNDAALERAINARITRINKQIKAAKGDQVRIKQLVLERERLKNQLEEAADKEKEGKSAQQFFFEQLQAQQGFASNLLGNLITGPTAGLVGVPAPTTGPGRGIATAALVQEGKNQGGPTAGQASTTNAILIRIENLLKTLNGATATPEATHQRRVGIADMDGPGLGGR